MCNPRCNGMQQIRSLYDDLATRLTVLEGAARTGKLDARYLGEMDAYRDVLTKLKALELVPGDYMPLLVLQLQAMSDTR